MKVRPEEQGNVHTTEISRGKREQLVEKARLQWNTNVLKGCGRTGTPILVPLTPSLYVPGKLASTKTVLVDVGTGFYVEKVSLGIFSLFHDARTEGVCIRY